LTKVKYCVIIAIVVLEENMGLSKKEEEQARKEVREQIATEKSSIHYNREINRDVQLWKDYLDNGVVSLDNAYLLVRPIKNEVYEKLDDKEKSRFVNLYYDKIVKIDPGDFDYRRTIVRKVRKNLYLNPKEILGIIGNFSYTDDLNKDIHIIEAAKVVGDQIEGYKFVGPVIFKGKAKVYAEFAEEYMQYVSGCSFNKDYHEAKEKDCRLDYDDYNEKDFDSDAPLKAIGLLPKEIVDLKAKALKTMTDFKEKSKQGIENSSIYKECIASGNSVYEKCQQMQKEYKDNAERIRLETERQRKELKDRQQAEKLDKVNKVRKENGLGPLTLEDMKNISIKDLKDKDTGKV
jgi:hypothetical protein